MPHRRRARLSVRLHRLLVATVSLTLLSASWWSASPAGAHEEREATFPAGHGSRPHFLGYDNPRHRVVCHRGSRARIAAMPSGPAKHRSRGLLDDCRFSSIQSAIDSVRRRHTSVYVLPGVYHERRIARSEPTGYCARLDSASKDPLLTAQYVGSLTELDNAPEADPADEDSASPVAISYPDQVRCPHNLNLITVFGDRSLRNKSIACDSRWCGLQLVGTGRRQDVVIDNRFSKLNAVRADRAGGIYLRGLTVQQAEFNAVYVLETDGFVVDRVVARGNDEYGILAFASDHGLIKGVNAYYNGDSGIYPGSASDLNGDSTRFRVDRYAVEIRHSRSHHNTLGYSGTAGNSVWAHDNWFYANATGIATDSLFPGHPGLPQDHARWNRNRIFSNNANYYTRYVDRGVCDKPMRQRGYLDGVVCPVVPTPVGTGVLIAGGNYNSTDHNWIYDNWRYGTMQFWVPAPLRDEYDPTKLYDTSHHNHTVANVMGISPDGRIRPNGLDHWWDDEGEGNCWVRNRSSHGEPTHNFTVVPGSCADGGSVFTPGTAAVKDAGFLSCSQYNRADPTWRHPPECEWFDSPTRPGTGRSPLATTLMSSVSGLPGDASTPVAAVLFVVTVACGLFVPRVRGRVRGR